MRGPSLPSHAILVVRLEISRHCKQYVQVETVIRTTKKLDSEFAHTHKSTADCQIETFAFILSFDIYNDLTVPLAGI